MAEISIEDFCIALYCAYTRFDSVAPDATGTIAFTARTLDAEHEEYYRVHCSGVRGYHFRSDSQDAKWTQAIG